MIIKCIKHIRLYFSLRKAVICNLASIFLLFVPHSLSATPTPFLQQPHTLKLHTALINDQAFTLTIAKTASERKKGLMFVPSLPSRNGMLFVFPENDIHPFWMKNTLIPLDIIWINDSYKIVYIHKHAEPYSTVPIYPTEISRFVLEINAGESNDYNIHVGDYVTF